MKLKLIAINIAVTVVVATTITYISISSANQHVEDNFWREKRVEIYDEIFQQHQEIQVLLTQPTPDNKLLETKLFEHWHKVYQLTNVFPTGVESFQIAYESVVQAMLHEARENGDPDFYLVYYESLYGFLDQYMRDQAELD